MKLETMHMTPHEKLRHYVTGAIERGEGEPIVEQRANHNWGDWSHIPTTAAGSRHSTVRRDIVADSEFGPAFIAGDILPSHANLIAAAPDLLSALQELAQEYSALLKSNGASMEIGCHGSECKAGEWVQRRLQSPFVKARAAISKANGGEQ